MIDVVTSNAPDIDFGQSSLGSFLQDAEHNTGATRKNHRVQCQSLAAIDDIYCKIVASLDQSLEFMSGFFLIRAHSSFRGAIRLCASGQIAEAYMVLRGTLESALYGLYVAGNTARQEVWLRRHEDEVAKRRVRNEFTIQNVMRHLAGIDGRTHDIAQSLYERPIDLGGHPNERAISAQVTTDSSQSEVKFTAEYFVSGLPLQLCLKSAAQVGICGLDVFSHVWPHRYRILCIDHALDRARQNF
jgi:hypothetical protein